MTSKGFNDLFREAYRTNITVQNSEELLHIFELMRTCNSYLEVGSAEGGSLWVLAHALQPYSKITCVDRDQSSVGKARKSKIKSLAEEKIYVKEIIGNSHNQKTIKEVSISGLHDCVMLDAGHKYHDVVADLIAYGGLAKKYIFVHDITQEDVDRAFTWYVVNNECRSYKVIKSNEYGYGVIRL